MARHRVRFPMLLKFFVGCSALALLLVGAGTYLVQRERSQRVRVDYLAKNFERYADSEQALGQGIASVADLLAHDETLRTALGAPPTVDGIPPARSASQVAQTMFERVSGKNGVRPDLFLVVDGSGKLVWRNDDAVIAAEDLRSDDSSAGTLDPIAMVTAGQDFFNEILVHRGRAVQLAGVPIRALDRDTVIGGLLLGRDVERSMLGHKLRSDRDENRQQSMVMIANDVVVASPFPRETWKDLAGAIRDASSGAGEQPGARPVVRFGDSEYDMFRGGPVFGFRDGTRGEVAQQFLLRPRTAAADREPGLPLVEGGLGLLFSFVIASLLALWITRPIKRFVAQSRAILEGGADLSQRIEISAWDETADLAENINQVFARLHTLAGEVQTAAFQVGASSAEISAASKQMLEGLRDQTLKIESSTAAVTELSASIQQVAVNAVEATKVAEKSNIAVTSAVDRMQQIRTAVEEAGEKMKDLGDSSKRIGNIVEVIRQISEQTSLLALNASIEAAHAGEQGRGFAVVADEVSSLARRVGQSAKDIEALIQTIKEQTADALHSMEVGTNEVEQGTELVTNTLNDLGQLISVVNDTAAAVQEQAEVSDEIARNMDAVQKIAAEMVSGSEEAVQQGEQLHTLAFGLEQSVGGFNIDGVGGNNSRRAAPRPADARDERDRHNRPPQLPGRVL